jgi:putative transposase
VINRKRTYRLYKAENLTVRRGRRYVRPSANACGSSFPGGATSAGRWTSQLMRCGPASAFDACAWLMTPLGRARHSCPIFPSAASGPCALLDELACRHGPLAEIVMDNGPEFSGRAHFAWSARTGVRLRFVQPGKPIPNAFVESFIGRFRDECLNQHWFASLAEAARLIEAWRQHYNPRAAAQRAGLRTARAVRATARRARTRSRFAPPRARSGAGPVLRPQRLTFAADLTSGERQAGRATANESRRAAGVGVETDLT